MQCNAGSEGTLYDFAISNNGGRVRVVIYDKGIQDRIRLVTMGVWVLFSLLCSEINGAILDSQSKRHTRVSPACHAFRQKVKSV